MISRTLRPIRSPAVGIPPIPKGAEVIILGQRIMSSGKGWLVEWEGNTYLAYVEEIEAFEKEGTESQ